MSIAHDEVLKSALARSESERILLATELLDFMSGAASGLLTNAMEFEAELDRRFNDGTRSTS